MNYVIVLLPLLCLWFSLAYGQEEPWLENIHLHLNKTAFIKAEHLWFTAYVQDQKNQLPSTSTTNLHVGVFSKEGKEIAKKILLVNQGVSYGDFKIDSTFINDSYTLMAWTHYMKNFEVATPSLRFGLQVLRFDNISTSSMQCPSDHVATGKECLLAPLLFDK